VDDGGSFQKSACLISSCSRELSSPSFGSRSNAVDHRISKLTKALVSTARMHQKRDPSRMSAAGADRHRFTLHCFTPIKTVKFTATPQFPTYCICPSANSKPSNNNSFLSASIRWQAILYPAPNLNSICALHRATQPEALACGGHPGDPLEGWFVLCSSSLVTTQSF
jgi:hypothetical protein